MMIKQYINKNDITIIFIYILFYHHEVIKLDIFLYIF
jgi:hypothetical protein